MIFKRQTEFMQSMLNFIEFLESVYKAPDGKPVHCILDTSHPLRVKAFINDTYVVSTLEEEMNDGAMRVWEHKSFWRLCGTAGIQAVLMTHTAYERISADHVEMVFIIPDTDKTCDCCGMDCTYTGRVIPVPIIGGTSVNTRMCPSCLSKLKDGYMGLFSEAPTTDKHCQTPVKINFWARLKRLVGLDG